ncbi:extracellular solute-binding protein [Thaumasiovibrio subtropicus]|uniref:extracellular solute-binding protein n=1 Tax=Thaumasiovibrio subtropicus TaxID=1891207 RepID=UPI000B35CE56|nr:extracellular solute-binding protein [Thaumasiovibrio subtropicus]
MKKLLMSLTALSAMWLSPSWANTLPEGLNWINNNDQATFGDANAKQGGTYRLRIESFPLTMRTVGPDSNGSFRPFLLDGNPLLMQMHPNTRKNIPAIAKEWAYADDNKTMYFRLDPAARWSDGEEITAEDFEFVFEYMTSEHIKAPWYTNFFSTKVVGITVYDDYTFALHSADALARDELSQRLNIGPRPAHYYPEGIPSDWVRRYNWKNEPVTGPYHVSKIKKGRYVTLDKVEDWWGYTNKYYQHRYNVDRIRIKVIRDKDIAIKHFEKGDIDSFAMTFPSLWHDKGKGELYDTGYLHKSWLYNNQPQGAAGVWLNLQDGLMSDANIRKGIAHSLNVKKMIDIVLRGDYVQLQAFGSGYGVYDNKDIRAEVFDPEAAIDYFAKAGFDTLGDDGVRVNAKGERLAITMTYLSKMHTPRVVVLKEEARKTGLEINLKLVDGATGFKSLLEKKHQVAFLGMGSGMLPAYWQYFHSDNAKTQTNNFTNYADPEMDALIDQFDSEFDSDVKAALSRKIQTKIADCDCVIPTYSVPFARGAHWRYVKLPEGLGTSLSSDILDASRIEYGLFWIDTEEKARVLEALDDDKVFEPSTTIDRRFLSN